MADDQGNGPNRAHGVTPGLSQDYARRTAEHQAAFVRSYLSPGLDLLDVGCGPGSITVGLAELVAPGQVVGIDHDEEHVANARALAAERGLDNVTFRVGDALSLPYERERFDIAFENDLLVHVASRAADAVREIERILKPGGVFAARDVDFEAALWGNQTPEMCAFDELFFRWRSDEGSDMSMGRRLPAMLRAAGFDDIVTSVSADTKGTAPEVHDHARIMLFLLDGPVGRAAVERGDADEGSLERMAAAIRTWGRHPDSFFANVHVEVVGRKPA